MVHVARFDKKPNRGALLAVDQDVGKRRDAGQFHAGGCHEPARDRYGLHCLVERTGSDGLHLHRALLADDSGERARDRVRVRFARHLEDFHCFPHCCSCDFKAAGRPAAFVPTIMLRLKYIVPLSRASVFLLDAEPDAYVIASHHYLRLAGQVYVVLLAESVERGSKLSPEFGEIGMVDSQPTTVAVDVR